MSASSDPIPIAAAERLPSCRHIALLVLSMAAVCLMTGCGVHRRMTIVSDPPGALVLVEGREVGYTPVSLDFIYYGTREITLIKDGYETKTVLQALQPPWYQIPPLDFFSDNFLPYPITDRHVVRIPMEPKLAVPNQDLLDRAEALRTESRLAP